MVRLLHTSDWHLGVSMNEASCQPEQRRFLDWLVETIEQRAIDVLVVAGDIFHFRQPSNSAWRMYYDFLRRCSDETDLQQVVITAGNHDSPSGLESSAPVVETLDVTVVGALSSTEDPADRCLVPVVGESGQVEAVISAVPYVRPAQLGVSGIGGEPAEVRRAFEEAFGQLYTELADAAYDRWGEVPLVATGHMTCRSEDRSPDKDDYNTPIHSVGTIEALDTSLFDDRYDYVALGHIHKPFPVDKPRVWYSGTPVATSQDETSARKVIDVDLSGPAVIAEPVEVPKWRQIHKVEGGTDEVLEQLRSIENLADLPPFVFVHIREDDIDYENRPFDRVQELCRDEFDEPHPRIVEFKTTSTGEVDVDDGPPEQLDELSPQDVFVRVYKSKHDGQTPQKELLQAFEELLVQDSEDEPESEQAVQQELTVGTE